MVLLGGMGIRKVVRDCPIQKEGAIEGRHRGMTPTACPYDVFDRGLAHVNEGDLGRRGKNEGAVLILVHLFG